MSSSFTNALAHEKSPYLLRHKNNLVDWKPWGEDAFRLAKSLNRPIFLSVGYSTCHWCYVMERESFENELISKADLLFFSFHVDREERPDVDTYYMNFVRNISNSAGWPMSVFMDYHAVPFMGGSYFPPFSQDGRMGFAALLKLIADTWSEEPTLLRSQWKSMRDSMVPVHIHCKDANIPNNEELVTKTVEKYEDQFDHEFGGLKSHSKFSRAPILALFNVLIGRIGPKESELKTTLVTMVDRTLKALSLGGIRDHMEGGFHRYTVDHKWIVPHFEKMLYDQGQLLTVFAEFSLMAHGRYNFILEEVVSYLSSRLKHTEGGFYTAEDAVSHASVGSGKEVEGAFYVWDYSEVAEALKNSNGIGGLSAAELFTVYYNISEDGNAAHTQDITHDLYRKNVLYMSKPHDLIASELGVSSIELDDTIKSLKNILSKVRCSRPHPFVDSKILTDYQGHVLSGLAKAYQALNCEKTLKLAENCAEFCKKYLEIEEGGLRHCVFKTEDNTIEFSTGDVIGFSQDYAYYIQGLLDLYSVSGNEDLLLRAKKLQHLMIEKLWDETENEYGFFMCEDSALKNGLRSEGDGVEPAPSAIAASNLLRLSCIYSDDILKEYAEKIFRGVGKILAM
ncbi:unnamed protein product [Auanema sp. JU1783]|nr:unnamed protein product [Auanema sp. JU1783]